MENCEDLIKQHVDELRYIKENWALSTPIFQSFRQRGSSNLRGRTEAFRKNRPLLTCISLYLKERSQIMLVNVLKSNEIQVLLLYHKALT